MTSCRHEMIGTAMPPTVCGMRALSIVVKLELPVCGRHAGTWAARGFLTKPLREP